MFVSNQNLIHSLEQLSSLHPFYGITYLACKLNNMPIGEARDFPINAFETELLEKYYKPEKRTTKFFRAFRVSEKNKYWLKADYASSGSQATRTQSFQEAFIHERNSNSWGWNENFIEILSNKLNGKKIPAYSLAFWMLKDIDWEENTDPSLVLETFFKKFNINEEEKTNLFNLDFPDSLIDSELFSNSIYLWHKIANNMSIPSPPDLPVEKGGALVSLTLKNIEPYENFKLDFAKRCNIITGDNGLGKSFLLECAWWALTGSWTTFPIYPRDTGDEKTPQIAYDISSNDGSEESFTADYDWKTFDWKINRENQKTIPGLVLYALVDGAFAIWDPARVTVESRNNNFGLPPSIVFSKQDVWDGLHVSDGPRSRAIFNGLITDWVHWKNTNVEAFNILKRVLKTLSPPNPDAGDLGQLEPGEIVRIPGESRPIPTIKHSYGEVPVVFASAAVKRIIAFAYLIVWTWEEHKASAKMMKEQPESKMVVIADEIESHLHPQWQRLILPALASISGDLTDQLDIQFLITTHSPLVMASAEPFYDDDSDKIFHLDLNLNANEKVKVTLTSPRFEKRGTSDSWLTSSTFEMKQPRSIEAEQALEEAKQVMMEKNPQKKRINELSGKLSNFLAAHDTFWIRWNYFAEKNGIKV